MEKTIFFMFNDSGLNNLLTCHNFEKFWVNIVKKDYLKLCRCGMWCVRKVLFEFKYLSMLLKLLILKGNL